MRTKYFTQELKDNAVKEVVEDCYPFKIVAERLGRVRIFDLKLGSIEMLYQAKAITLSSYRYL